ncbi:MAG: MarR family transcriptional regulator [Candidatus Dormiibacterota bacterium]
MAQLHELMAALRRLNASDAALDRAAAKRMGINRTDLDAIEALDRLGPLAATELARAVGLTNTAATTLIDRLVGAGYVERLSDDADRRRVVVRPTSKAMAASKRFYRPVDESSRTVFAAYSEKELTLLLEFVNQAEAMLRERAARVEAETT